MFCTSLPIYLTIERDAERYLECLEKSQTSAEVVTNEVDQKVLTVGKYHLTLCRRMLGLSVGHNWPSICYTRFTFQELILWFNIVFCSLSITDDLHRLRQGLENQYYDAFLLYADEDVNFATEMVDRLENRYKLKVKRQNSQIIKKIKYTEVVFQLCLKDRDLIGGVTFEHEAVMTLISERCNRLIVIVSSNFLKSPANKFFLNYAQALGIGMFHILLITFV